MNILQETEVILRCRFNNFATDKAFKQMDFYTLARLDDLLDSLLQACFKYGLEYGKQEMRNNIQMMEEDEDDHDKYVSVGSRQQKESESSKLINNLHSGENIFEFTDAKTARRKFDSLRKFAKYRGIPLMMKQQGNLLFIKKE